MEISFVVLLVASLCCAAYSQDAVVTEKVYLDIAVEGEEAARVIIGMFGAISPKTVHNFVALATHEVIHKHSHVDLPIPVNICLLIVSLLEGLWLQRNHFPSGHSQLYDARYVCTKL